jgi:hypothetical protein
MKSQSSGKTLVLLQPGLLQSGRSSIVASDAVGQVISALDRLERWIEAEEFKGWDPHDALNSPFFRWAGGQRLIGIALLQLLRRSPVNLRPLLGIRKGYNPKAMGLFLATYAQKYETNGQEGYLERTRYFFNWLVRNASPGYAGPCWGYNFGWPNRAFLAPAGTPTIVNTAFIGLAFLCAGSVQGCWAGAPEVADERMPSAEQGKEPWLSVRGSVVARGACDFILRDLHTLRPSADELCFSYTPLDQRFVHNANMLGAWLLAAVYTRTRESALAEAAIAAARFTARRQRADGSWVYGISRRDGWVDNFHTGYVLVALNRVGACLKTGEFDSVVRAGYEFWKTHMFESGDIPKYHPDRTYPIDIHSVAQAILTFLEFEPLDPEAGGRAARVALWAIQNMRDPKGFFQYQLHRSFRIGIPYMRWSQAWMQQALIGLCSGQWLTGSEVQKHANLG